MSWKNNIGPGNMATRLHIEQRRHTSFNRMDLCVSGQFDIVSTIRSLSISRVAVPFDGKPHEGAVYRLRTAPSNVVNYPYLIVSENLDAPTDILTIRDFSKDKRELKKKLKKGTGLEILINPARKMDSVSVGRWFSSLTDLYRLCHWARCQFVISSGATSKYEMVSGPSLDAILKTVGIEPQSYWSNLTKWLEQRLARNVSYAKEAT